MTKKVKSTGKPIPTLKSTAVENDLLKFWVLTMVLNSFKWFSCLQYSAPPIDDQPFSFVAVLQDELFLAY